MALVSPGVQVTVTDQSQYVPSVASSVPYILLVTASNKPSAAGLGIAPGTLAENANKLYLMTSQEDLLATFGQPYFYNNSQGTPINGYELNEYGLLAAYSALAQTSRLYIQRADIDLSQLTASLTRPVTNPTDGTYWFDTSLAKFSFSVWNNTTETFTPINTNNIKVLNDSTYLNPGTTQPRSSYGARGDIVMVTTSKENYLYQKVGLPSGVTTNIKTPPLWKQYDNTWQIIGSAAWARFNPVFISPTVNYTNPSPDGNINWKSAFNSVGYNIDATNLLTWTENITQFVNGVYATYKNVNESAGTFNMVFFVDPSASIQSYNFIGMSNYWERFSNGTYSTVPYTLYGYSQFQASPSTQYPIWSKAKAPYYPDAITPFDHARNNNLGNRWISYVPSASMWQTTNYDAYNKTGTLLVMKRYSEALGQWIPQNVKTYANNADANYGFDPSGGGSAIPVDTIYAQYRPSYQVNTSVAAQYQFPRYLSGFQFWRRASTGSTVVTTLSVPNTFVVGNQFSVTVSIPGTPNYTTTVNATLQGTTSNDFITAFNTVAPSYAYAEISADGYITFTHTQGGDIILANITGTPLTTAGITTNVPGISTNNGFGGGYILSSWVTDNQFQYYSSATAPTIAPENNTVWYWSDPTQADIMIQNNGQWCGYRTVTSSFRGENLTLTNANGPLFSTTPPTTQNDPNLSPLVAGDLWIDTSDLENFPKLYRWQSVNSIYKWVLIDNTDHTTPNGITFADARWAYNGTINPGSGAIPPITNMLLSNYLDLDAPSPATFANGMLLFNTRRSGYNVKKYQTDYFTQINFSGASSYPAQTATWLSISTKRLDNVPFFGRQAQRSVIVKALKSGIDSNIQVREEQRTINLIACPQYPELAPNMVALNNERNDTSFVLVDTPLRLSPDNVVTWATNNNGLGLPTQDGLLVNEPYSATWYPSCLTTDLSGNQVVQPPSHMIIRTILRSDYESYPWLAPAGTQRGLVDNALQIGYLNAQTNQFVSIGVNQGLRDVLYTHQVNPITTVQGSGIVNFGNKTTTGVTSALDRINVSRLVAYLRSQLEYLAKQYLFEPNDQITRNNITNSITSLMVELVAKRAIYDYLVVCDTTNNTPARIDRNELWVDIAIEPVKAVEFIYIPIRIKNTGSIQAGT